MTTMTRPMGPMSAPPAPVKRKRSRPVRTSLLAHGEPMLWLTGGALAVATVMIVGLMVLVLVQGSGTFWPRAVVEIKTHAGQTVQGEVTRSESFTPSPELLASLEGEVAAAAKREIDAGDGRIVRRLVRVGNYELTGDHFRWVSQIDVVSESLPQWVVTVERLAWGRFYGTLKAFKIDGEIVASGPEETWRLFNEHHASSRDRFHKQVGLEKHETGEINSRIEAARLRMRDAEINAGHGSKRYVETKARYDEVKVKGDADYQVIRTQIDQLKTENARYAVVFDTAQGKEQSLQVSDIVRAYPANQVADSLSSKLGVYAGRWWEFLTNEPREANSEGGVFPAIFGTVLMTLIMCMLVVPFGVMAALYLREYAKAGPIITAVRIAINNLAGVPSIVFGVFGLGFFCYIIGGGIDSLFYEAKLADGNPTFGKGALIWASFTLALLTLPVVIVATEEALSAVPNSMREGSYACGASKWQTIKRIVLPRALPGVMTGAILAMARGAGEVAPLMLVGAVKLAPELPFSVHPSEQFGMNRSFMHLGFHIYDLGFQSQNSEAAKPMVYTTTLLLIVLIAVLNLAAIWLRSKLRRKFEVSGF